MAFQTEITPLGNTASFRDWFLQYNDSVLSKLNNADIAFANAGDGITLESSSNGGYTFALSGTVAKQMTFQNSVVFEGNVSLNNVELSGLVYGLSGNYLSQGITFGKVVRLTSSGGLTFAKADSAQNAEVMGIVISATSSKTLVAVAGKISGTTLANNLVSGGFTSGCVYFLDPVVAGGLTRAEPVSFGQVSKPMILGVNTGEGVILPYRGQYINGICGGSGDNLFNSAVFITVGSRGDSEADFGLRPGNIIAIDTGFPVSAGMTSYSSQTNSYNKATNSTPLNAILGIATEYVGSYSNTPTTPVTVKVNTIGSVVNNISNFNSYWNNANSPVVYLNAQGNPSSGQPNPPVLTIGNVADGNLIFNPSSSSSSFIGGAASKSGSIESGGISNYLINGSLSLWQRGRGTTSPFGITCSSSGIKEYVADKWIMWGTSGEAGFTAQRQEFSLTQTEIPGYPQYYVQLRKNTSSNGYAYFYNVLDDVRTIANKTFTLSFYARTPGGTGTFAIHTIQNIGSGAGTTYLNGTTHSVETTINSTWGRYSTTFVGPAAISGITGSYSLVGVRLDNNGTTYEFAQFILEDGATASVPGKIDINAEYERIAPYYQRSYSPNVSSGSSTTDNFGVLTHLIPPYKRIHHKFPVRLNKIPTVKIYSLSGTENIVSIFTNSGYMDALDSTLQTVYSYDTCSRSALPSGYPVSAVLAITPFQSNMYVNIVYSQLFCNFDEIAFHYVADADTTIN